MNKPEMPDPLDVLTALALVGATALVLCVVAMMLIDVVAYGMEKLS